jgi:hypothetical protein
MRKLLATIATLAMTTHFAGAADWPLCPSYEVNARAHSGVVLAVMGLPPPMLGGGGGTGGGGTVGGGMPSMGGGSFMGGMHPMGSETFPGGGTRAGGADPDPPRAKTRNNLRSRKTSGVQ